MGNVPVKWWKHLSAILFCIALQNKALNYEHVVHSLAALACNSDNKANKQDLLPKIITAKTCRQHPGEKIHTSLLTPAFLAVSAASLQPLLPLYRVTASECELHVDCWNSSKRMRPDVESERNTTEKN